MQFRPPREQHIVRFERDVPKAIFRRDSEKLGCADVDLAPEVPGQAYCQVCGNAIPVETDDRPGYAEEPRSLIARLQELDLDVLADDLQAVGACICSRVRPGELRNRVALHPEPTAFELANLDARIADQDPVDLDLPVEDKARHRDADTHALRGNGTRRIVGTNQFGVIELELRPAQTPARIHTGEFDLHADGVACPALQLFLVLRQSRQEQSEQADHDGEQDQQGGRRVG